MDRRRATCTGRLRSIVLAVGAGPLPVKRNYPSGLDGKPEMRALALNAAVINTQFCGNFIPVYQIHGGHAAQIRSNREFRRWREHRHPRSMPGFYHLYRPVNRAEMKNGHHARVDGRGLPLRFLRVLITWYDSIEWIFIRSRSTELLIATGSKGTKFEKKHRKSSE